MNPIRLRYAKWKSIAQNGSLSTTYMTTQRANRVRAWCGNKDQVFVTLVDTDDYNDWDSNFSGSATEVLSEGEAVATLIEDASGGAIDNSSTVVNVSASPGELIQAGWAGKGAPRLEQWSDVSMPQSVSDSYETVWSKSSSGIFYIALFQVNNDQMYFRVRADGITIIDTYLDDLHDDFDLKSDGGSNNSYNQQLLVDFPLLEYSSKKWRFRPNVPIRFDSSLQFDFKSNSGNKKVERGISSWGVL